jgi:NADPH-dependent 2,4-dienoyl-CoA reductase/sulfur reductase-like enzyme
MFSRRASRRQILKLGLASAAAAGLTGMAAPLGFVRRSAHAMGQNGRVVIVGGGFGGAALAGELRRRAPEAEIVLIDPWPNFFSAASSVGYVLGDIALEAATRSYASLEAQGVRRIEAKVRGIDPHRRVVGTDGDDFDYSVLVLATGIELRPEAIPGLAEAEDRNLSLYDRRSLPALRQALERFDGGRIVISVPDGALKCPPAPYEYALMLTRMIRERNLDGEVMLLDAWPSPQPDSLGDALSAALEAESDILTYFPAEPVSEVDADAGVVITDFGDELPFDLLSLIPPNGTSALLGDLDLTMEGDQFAEVDPLTMRSLRQDGIYVLGDAARTPYGRTAASAAAVAEFASMAIAAELAQQEPPDFDSTDPALIRTACYPYRDPEAAFRLAVSYSAYRSNGEVVLGLESEVDNEASATNAEARRDWERDLLMRIFAG